MDEEEKYLFDLRGYLVVKNALTAEQVGDLSQRLEQRRDIEKERANTCLLYTSPSPRD